MNNYFANMLLDLEAIQINFEKKYTWTSGIESPIYCDNRLILSNPSKWDIFIMFMAREIQSLFPDVKCIAGVSTAGIPHGAAVAIKLGLPFVYVRPEPKKYGMGKQIEGKISPDTKCVVIEDLISTGKSSFAAVKALQDQNVMVLGLFSIFNYQTKASEKLLKDLPVVSLTNFDSLVNIAFKRNIITLSQKEELVDWKQKKIG